MSVLVASPRPVTRWRPSTVVAYVLLIALAVFFQELRVKNLHLVSGSTVKRLASSRGRRAPIPMIISIAARGARDCSKAMAIALLSLPRFLISSCRGPRADV